MIAKLERTQSNANQTQNPNKQWEGHKAMNKQPQNSYVIQFQISGKRNYKAP